MSIKRKFFKNIYLNLFFLNIILLGISSCSSPSEATPSGDNGDTDNTEQGSDDVSNDPAKSTIAVTRFAPDSTECDLTVLGNDASDTRYDSSKRGCLKIKVTTTNDYFTCNTDLNGKRAKTVVDAPTLTNYMVLAFQSPSSTVYDYAAGNIEKTSEKTKFYNLPRAGSDLGEVGNLPVFPIQECQVEDGHSALIFTMPYGTTNKDSHIGLMKNIMLKKVAITLNTGSELLSYVGDITGDDGSTSGDLTGEFAFAGSSKAVNDNKADKGLLFRGLMRSDDIDGKPYVFGAYGDSDTEVVLDKTFDDTPVDYTK